MRGRRKIGAVLILCCLGIVSLGLKAAPAAQPGAAEAIEFPRSLDSYDDTDMGSIGAILKNRIAKEPFNLFATLIFLLAIVHTFMASKFLAIAHKWEEVQTAQIKAGELEPDEMHLGPRLFHFLGEVEVVFGLWAVVLAIDIVGFNDCKTIEN